MIRGRVGVVALGLALIAGSSGAAEHVAVAWHPSKPKLGDIAWLHVRDVPEGATVEEVAHMVVYAASPQASATTGAALRVDGGVVDTIA